MREEDRCRGSENGRHRYTSTPLGKTVCEWCGHGPLQKPWSRDEFLNLQSSVLKRWEQ